MAVPFRVPLKGGRKLRTRVLNPLVFCSKTEKGTAEKNMLSRLGGTNVEVLDSEDAHTTPLPR